MISLALCSTLFFVASNCMAFSQETQTVLRDVRADNLEGNGLIAVNNDDETERVAEHGADAEDESDADAEDSEDEDEDEAWGNMVELEDETTQFEGTYRQPSSKQHLFSFTNDRYLYGINLSLWAVCLR